MTDLTNAELTRRIVTLESTMERRALDYVRYDIYERDLREIRDDVKDIRTALDKAAESQRVTTRSLMFTGVTAALTFLTLLAFFVLERVGVG